MKVKYKTTAVLIGMLLIGVLIGFIGGGIFRKNIVESRLARFRSPDMFVRKINRIVQPDSLQRQKLEIILLRHHERIRGISSQFHERFRIQTDSLKNELEPVLTPEQQKRLRKYIERSRQPQKRFGGDRRPR